MGSKRDLVTFTLIMDWPLHPLEGLQHKVYGVAPCSITNTWVFSPNGCSSNRKLNSLC